MPLEGDMDAEKPTDSWWQGEGGSPKGFFGGEMIPENGQGFENLKGESEKKGEHGEGKCGSGVWSEWDEYCDKGCWVECEDGGGYWKSDEKEREEERRAAADGAEVKDLDSVLDSIKAPRFLDFSNMPAHNAIIKQESFDRLDENEMKLELGGDGVMACEGCDDWANDSGVYAESSVEVFGRPCALQASDSMLSLGTPQHSSSVRKGKGVSSSVKKRATQTTQDCTLLIQEVDELLGLVATVSPKESKSPPQPRTSSSPSSLPSNHPSFSNSFSARAKARTQAHRNSVPSSTKTSLAQKMHTSDHTNAHAHARVAGFTAHSNESSATGGGRSPCVYVPSPVCAEGSRRWSADDTTLGKCDNDDEPLEESRGSSMEDGQLVLGRQAVARVERHKTPWGSDGGLIGGGASQPTNRCQGMTSSTKVQRVLSHSLDLGSMRKIEHAHGSNPLPSARTDVCCSSEQPPQPPRSSPPGMMRRRSSMRTELDVELAPKSSPPALRHSNSEPSSVSSKAEPQPASRHMAARASLPRMRSSSAMLGTARSTMPSTASTVKIPTPEDKTSRMARYDRQKLSALRNSLVNARSNTASEASNSNSNHAAGPASELKGAERSATVRRSAHSLQAPSNSDGAAAAEDERPSLTPGVTRMSAHRHSVPGPPNLQTAARAEARRSTRELNLQQQQKEQQQQQQQQQGWVSWVLG